MEIFPQGRRATYLKLFDTCVAKPGFINWFDRSGRVGRPLGRRGKWVSYTDSVRFSGITNTDKYLTLTLVQE